jgi:hypothetical protein
MIGPKKLSTIRQELARALAATGDDPLCWLEERMAVPEHQSVARESQVVHSLRRIVEGLAEEKRTRRPKAPAPSAARAKRR